jgi:hypothetical protein
VLIAPGRRQAASADFDHFQSPSIGPWIEGNIVEGVADDSVNIYTRPFLMNGYTDANTVNLTFLMHGLAHVGDAPGVGRSHSTQLMAADV